MEDSVHLGPPSVLLPKLLVGAGGILSVAPQIVGAGGFYAILLICAL